VDEAEIEHLVGLVEDEDLDSAKRQRPAIDQIEEPPRGGDEHVDALREGTLLASERHAAEHDRCRKAQVAAVRAETVRDLACEFARWAEDERTAAAPLRLPWVASEPVQDGERKGGRFAGAGLGNPKKIAAGYHIGDGLGLDGGGLAVALFSKGLEDWRSKAESRE
jgi:hypothetical protein